VSASVGFVELVKEVLGGLGPITARRMFRGAGIYAEGVMFALIIDDTLYLKADEKTRAPFEAEGLAPFAYKSGGRTVATSYWRVPERLLDDPDEMTAWAHEALGVAKGRAAIKQRKRPSEPRGRR
jgi:DNA transformation protein